MADTRYVNLSLGTSGGDGSENNPWNASEMESAPQNSNGWRFKTKGNYSGTFSRTENDEVIIEKWVDEPWRFNITSGTWYISSSGYNKTLSGGLIYSTSDIDIGGLFDHKNMTIKTTGDIRIRVNTGTGTIKGSSFDAGRLYFDYASSGSVDFTDCILYNSVAYAPGCASAITINLNNCVSATASQTAFKNGYNLIVNEIGTVQYGWTPVALPAWDADEYSFGSNTLAVGINTPPQPGTTPYTSYETGLWGHTRYGIGGFSFPMVNYFDKSSANPAENVISTINRDFLVSKIQAAGTDTYFDATSEIHSVHVRYIHEADRQRKTIIHTGSNLQGTASWLEGARDGTWEKSKIVTYDANAAKNTLLRSDIGTNEDITTSDGTVSLNI